MGTRRPERPDVVPVQTWSQLTPAGRQAIWALVERNEILDGLLAVAKQDVIRLAKRLMEKDNRVTALDLRVRTAEATIRAQDDRQRTLYSLVRRLNAMLLLPAADSADDDDGPRDLEESALPAQLRQTMGELEATASGTRDPAPDRSHRPDAPPPEPPDDAWVNRRQTKRVNLMATASLSSPWGTITGVSENLSTGGIFVRTVVGPALGTAVGIRLTLPDRPVVEADGRVRWHRKSDEGALEGCGVVFHDLSPEAAAAITELVDALDLSPPDLDEDHLITLH